jgi:hypothetical protein
MGSWRRLVERWQALAVSTRALMISGAALIALLLIGALALPSYAASQAAARGKALGFAVEVGRARFGWGRLWLLDVSVSDPALPGTRAQLGAVALRPSFASGVAVTLHGARVEVVGGEKELSARLRALRGQEPSGAQPARERARRAIEFDGVDVRWQRGADRAVFGWGLRGSQAADGSGQVTADLLRFSGKRSGGDVRAVELQLESGKGQRRIGRIEAAQVALRFELEPPEPEEESSGAKSTAGKGPAARGAPRAATSSATRGASAKSAPSVTVKSAPAPSDAGTPAAAEPNSEFSSLKWAGLKAAFEQLTMPSFRSSVVALSVEMRRGEESLRVGPSRFALKREARATSVEIVPHASGSDAGTALTIRAQLPLDSKPAEVELSGGPVSLSTLGVREGDFGLVGVREARVEAEAHLVVPADASPISISSKGALENVRLRRAALAPNELSGIRLGWRLTGSVSDDGAEWSLRDTEFSVGDARVLLSGKVERRASRSAAELDVEVPLSSCSALFAAVPRGMAPLLEGVRMEGTFALKGSLAYDSEKPLLTRTKLEVNNQCRIAEAPGAISPRRFQNPWQREVKGADGSPMRIDSGPGTPDWTPYEGISPFLETAVVVCEDAGFFSHRGIDYRAIENSIRQNLEVGHFLRGGSTVTMQLAKNLYLGREKTLARKLQEAVLTLLLEQQLSKHELMELYLNVIEFGPGIYGVRQAAHYYFNEEPRALSLGQALYLGSILPSPDTQHFRPDGHVSPGWAGYLRKLMQVARKIRRISEDELEAGLAEEIVFREPSALAREVPPTDEDAPDQAPSDDMEEQSP